MWTGISAVKGAERTGYPTQKPVAIAERIIKASCPEDGVVLDCFAGCAYVAVAAERLNRDWVACDINPRAWTVFKHQFTKPKLARLTCVEPTHDFRAKQASYLDQVVTVYGPQELPTRITLEQGNPVPTLNLKPREYKVKSSIIPETEMLEELLKISGYQAWCCGFANRMPGGDIIRTRRNFHLDHLDSVSRAGTSHQITNRAPLCLYHNVRKSNDRLHLAEYRKEIARIGELLVNSVDDLVDLNRARAVAEQLLGEAYARQNPQRRLPRL